MSELHTLTGVDTGQYRVTTSHGTQYVLDLDAKTVTRYGAKGHEWSDEFFHVHPDAVLGGSMPKFTGHMEPITRDGLAFRYDRLLPVRVGEQLYADNTVEWRLSTPVVSIEEMV